MSKALVLGTLPRVLLAVVRSLGRAGVQVHTAWNAPDCPALRSRYLHRAHRLPGYRPEDNGWREALTALLRRERFDLLLPCTDWETIVCHQHRQELEKYGRLYLPNADSFAVLFDKARTGAWARSVGVPMPREEVFSDADQAEAALSDTRFPLFLKPAQSFRLDKPGEHQKVKRAATLEELRSMLTELTAAGPVVVQEFFPGRGVGVELLLDQGEPLLAFQHLRIHEPLHGGPSSYRQSVPVTPELLAAALKILRPLKYTGVAMAEFRQNPDSGAWVFLEVNARFWGSLPLAIAAGVDFPLALFQLLVLGQRSFPGHYRSGIYCRNLPLDLRWQWDNLFAPRNDPTLNARPALTALGEAAVHWLTGSEYSDTAAADDPGPAMAERTQLARQLWAAFLRRVIPNGWGRARLE
jgi:predicted ATP-grasp superfamily ATP-dependent carboligase